MHIHRTYRRYRHTFAQTISMISSIISSIHIADPSEAGLLNQPVMTRNQNYKLMESQFRYSSINPPRSLWSLRLDHSGFDFGKTSTALYQFAVVLDPLSEQAQRYTSLFEVTIHQILSASMLISFSGCPASHPFTWRSTSILPSITR